jgi:nucleoside-diphosphate-sugar epimerase
VRVAVTGGAGYIGTLASRELLAAGHEVRALDVLLHGQTQLADQLEGEGVELIRADVRDPEARKRLLDGTDAVVHLAAIVGDPACAADPEKANEINVGGTRALLADAGEAGTRRIVFASTCSNYGRMADPTVAIDETAELAPVSLYAEQKVAVERELLEGDHGIEAVCLRLATIYGAAPRMRFDLTVNEFTRDLWSERTLEVFGEQFWRPYVHVADAARAIRTVVEAPAEDVDGEVYNVGHSDENYRKLDLVELITSELGRGDVTFVPRDEDPRDYKVSFEKIRERLGFRPEMDVPGGIREIVEGLESGRFGDPFDGAWSNLGRTIP